MFKIKKYLQYRNTPNGKPRVLVEGVDYNIKTEHFLWSVLDQMVNDNEHYIDISIFSNEKEKKINLVDCRPLLTVKIEGVEWTEGDIAQYIQTKDLLYDIFSIGFDLDQESYNWFGVCLTRKVPFQNKTGSFFDDPTKYSKLLWGCSEEEGWRKVFELLNLKTYNQ